MSDRTERIRVAIDALGISQAELARRSGLAPQDLQRIVDGRVKKSKHLPAIARALNVDLEWLNTGRGSALEAEVSPEIAALRQAVNQLREDASWLREQLTEQLEENRRLHERIAELERGRGSASA